MNQTDQTFIGIAMFGSATETLDLHLQAPDFDVAWALALGRAQLHAKDNDLQLTSLAVSLVR